jgi:S-(hydroxymethyl)glutathione dehydrogenase/alcohol dehydrogenase
LELTDDIELAHGPPPGHVEIEVVAAGLCHSDLAGRRGDMPVTLPALLGHEVAGRVIRCGDEAGGLEPGDHVVVAAVPPCGACEFCAAGRFHLCVNFQQAFRGRSHHRCAGEAVFGFAGLGGFAERIIVSADAAVAVPPDIPFHLAAIVGCAVVTGVGAVVNAARVEPGSAVVVFGCGGVGMSAVQAARAAGAATIVAVDLSASRRDLALRMGATHAVSPVDLGDVAHVHRGFGYHYAFEAVGHPATIRQAYDATRPGGTVVVLGIGPRDSVAEISAYEFAWTAKTLMGSTYGSGHPRREFARILEMWRNGRLDLDGLVTHRWALDDINEAIGALEAGEGVRHVVDVVP